MRSRKFDGLVIHEIEIGLISIAFLRNELTALHEYKSQEHPDGQVLLLAGYGVRRGT